LLPPNLTRSNKLDLTESLARKSKQEQGRRWPPDLPIKTELLQCEGRSETPTTTTGEKAKAATARN
jgi:hypothetical protein